MTQPTFRASLPTDAPAIQALVRAAYAKWVPALGREPMPMMVNYAEAMLRHEFWLAFGDTDLTGLIETETRLDHIWVENLCVSPDQQGQGLGATLLGHATALAQAAGLAEVRLLTNAAFASNIAFYQRHGFQIDRKEPFRGGFTIYMRKQV